MTLQPLFEDAAYEQVNGDQNGDSSTARGGMSAEERQSAFDDLKKTEDEIETLRQVLQARVKHANELKGKLGLTPWVEIQHDINAGWHAMRDSNAVQKTEEQLVRAGGAVKTKLADVRQSTAFQSFERGMGSAFTNVKARLATSASMYGGLHSDAADGVATGEQAGGEKR